MNIPERLAIFYQRMSRAAPAKNAEAAFTLICRTLEEVEAEFSTSPKQNPPPQHFDGRMYSPQTDNIVRGRDHSMWVKTRHHRILIQPNGAFRIYRELPRKTLRLEFQKTGAAP